MVEISLMLNSPSQN